MAATSPTPQARRSDAARNREQILSAARQVLADRTAEVSMAEVSRRAGVGMATLYRNFPGRRELLEALYTEEVDALCLAAATPSDAPGTAIVTWLRRFIVFHQTKHPIAAELLRHANATDPVFGSSRARVLAAARPLLDAAQRAGQIRDDLTLEQILDLVLAAATVPGDHDYVEPILQAALAGLKA